MDPKLLIKMLQVTFTGGPAEEEREREERKDINVLIPKNNKTKKLDKENQFTTPMRLNKNLSIKQYQ